MTINFMDWQKSLHEARKEDDEEDEVKEPKGEEKIEYRSDRKADRRGRKYPTKIKVHDGDEDNTRVTEESELQNKETENMKTFSQFIQELEEAKKDDYWDFKDLDKKPTSNVRKIAGKAYGGAAQKDDDEDEAPKPAEKRGRGRPKGTASGARQQGSGGKKSYGGLAIHTLSLPNRNK